MKKTIMEQSQILHAVLKLEYKKKTLVCRVRFKPKTSGVKRQLLILFIFNEKVPFTSFDVFLRV